MHTVNIFGIEISPTALFELHGCRDLVYLVVSDNGYKTFHRMEYSGGKWIAYAPLTHRDLHERREILRQILTADPGISLAKLSRLFGVSPSTIFTDVAALQG